MSSIAILDDSLDRQNMIDGKSNITNRPNTKSILVVWTTVGLSFSTEDFPLIDSDLINQNKPTVQ